MLISSKIQQKIDEFAPHAEQLPGVVIIHDFRDLSVVYMNKNGLNILGITLDELKKLKATWHKIFFNEAEAIEYVPKVAGLLERNKNDEFISLFQQVKSRESNEWGWFLTSMKIFMWDDDGSPLLSIALATPVDPKHDISVKVERLLSENNFLRANYGKFQSLTQREKEILKLIGEGYSSAEIAEKLFISPATVDTHRRNIRAKLEIDSNFQVGEYVRAFNLL